jgi:flagellar motor switch protein FliN/FliY
MADESELIGPNEIETLLSQAKGSAATPPAGKGPTYKPAAAAFGGGTATATQVAAKPSAPASVGSGGDDIQLLLDHAEQAIASVNDPARAHADFQAFQFRDLAGSPPSSERATIDLLRDVELDLKIELGRTHMELEELLKLRRGSVVSLDKLAGDPVDVYVNGRLIARGEVLVLNDNFCVRVAELISGDD